MSPAAPPAAGPPVDPPPLKVDEPVATSMRHVASMFQPVADLLAARDSAAPATSYKALYDGWREDAEAEMDAITGEDPLSPKEAEGFRVAKEVGFSALQKFLDKARAIPWSKRPVEERLAHVKALMDRPQVPQRTPAWFAQGKEVLTASEFATLFGSPRAVGQLVLHKVPTPADEAPPTSHRLACLTCEMTSLDWGVRFEPVVKQILEKRWGATVQDTGRLMHPTDPHVAASPDGIIMAATDKGRIGRLVEIKCPIRREIGKDVPFEYWCQMQLQMEVTDIDECDYVEVKLQSPEKGSSSMDLSGAEPEGFVWLLQHGDTAEMKYAYTVQERAEAEAAGWSTLESIPWRVAEFHTVTVVRDRAWYVGTADARAAFWEKVGAARRGAFQCPESSRKPREKLVKGTTVIVCKIEDD
jgi:hypothetical protein